MAALQDALQQVNHRIERAYAESGRSPSEISLIAVSKAQTVDSLRALAAAGQRAFGESYLQEALPKMAALADLALEWHFIGPIQSNKTRPIAEQFAWVHSVDRLKIAERLSAQRPIHLSPLNVCIEVNISGEASKGGVAPADLTALAQAVAQLPRLRLRGLMAIPAASTNRVEQRAAFHQVSELLRQLRTLGLPLDTVSMGMSDDLEAAIAEGATHLRIGAALFGARR